MFLVHQESSYRWNIIDLEPKLLNTIEANRDPLRIPILTLSILEMNASTSTMWCSKSTLYMSNLGWIIATTTTTTTIIITLGLVKHLCVCWWKVSKEGTYTLRPIINLDPRHTLLFLPFSSEGLVQGQGKYFWEYPITPLIRIRIRAPLMVIKINWQ